jgi:hypothetical protein
MSEQRIEAFLMNTALNTYSELQNKSVREHSYIRIVSANDPQSTN